VVVALLSDVVNCDAAVITDWVIVALLGDA